MLAAGANPSHFLSALAMIPATKVPCPKPANNHWKMLDWSQHLKEKASRLASKLYCHRTVQIKNWKSPQVKSFEVTMSINLFAIKMFNKPSSAVCSLVQSVRSTIWWKCGWFLARPVSKIATLTPCPKTEALHYARNAISHPYLWQTTAFDTFKLAST